MESLLITGLILLNVMLLVVLGLVLRKHGKQKSEGAVNGLSIVYFKDISQKEGWFSKTTKVTLKGQLYYNELPIGGPVVLSEQTLKKANQERIDMVFKEMVLPFSKIGADALTAAVNPIALIKNS